MDSAITLNDYVYVRLTEHGQQVVRDARDALRARMPPAARSLIVDHEERDGWSRWQFWSLIQEFGDHCGAGQAVTFDGFTTEPPDAWRSKPMTTPVDITAITREVSRP